LELTGIGRKRLKLAWVSSAEAQRFAQVARDIVQDVKDLGPLDPQSYKLELTAARRTLDGEIVRWTVGTEKRIIEQGDVYDRSWDEERFHQVLDQIATKEYTKNLIYSALEQDCRTVRDVGARTGLELKQISYLLADMERNGMVEFKGMHEHKPEFATL
jgi:predicted Rossmann fold nucleotide-binding protein DprA/Smf involved in DNA uptake